MGDIMGDIPNYLYLYIARIYVYLLKGLPRGRVELPRVAPLAPKASASTSSATFAPVSCPVAVPTLPRTTDRRAVFGGPCRDRTCDPLIKSQHRWPQLESGRHALRRYIHCFLKALLYFRVSDCISQEHSDAARSIAQSIIFIGDCHANQIE